MTWQWDDDHVAAFDFETSGTKPEYALQPFRIKFGDAWATSLAWVWPEGGRLIPDGGLGVNIEMMRRFLGWAILQNRRVWGWNTAFDISILLAYGLEDLVYKVNWGDGMLLWRHVEIEPEYDDAGPKKSYGLKAYVREFIPEHADYEAEIDFHDPDPTVRAALHRYNVKDCAFTLRACKRLWKALTPRQQGAVLLEADCLPFVASANLRGLLVDTIASHDVGLKLEAQAAKELAALAPYGVTEKIVRSSKQLAALMFGEGGWGLTPLKKSPTGNYSTDKETLHELSFVDPRAKQLRSYREALNQKTKFSDGLIESVDYCQDGGRCHPQAKVFGTYSGRFTYSSKQEARVTRIRHFKTKPDREETVNALLPIGFALHQMKRGPEFRRQIVVPPGYTMVEFDAAGQEFRWMAISSGDATMLQLCLPGEDAHSFMGTRVDHNFEYQELITLNHELDELRDDMVTPRHKQAKQTRYAGKVGNLSLQYRTSARRFMITARVDYGLPIELPEAERIHGIYQRTYTGVPKYWKSQIALTKQLGYVETFAGRRVQVLGDWSGSFGWGMGSTAINYRIQGCLHYGSRVHTSNGLIPIGELVGQTCTVWTGFKWAAATAVNRGPCQLAEIELVSGEVIKCDTRHKLKSSNREWVEFVDIHPGTSVVLPRHTPPLEATPEVTWPYILGLYLGDGWLMEHKRSSRHGTRRQFAICAGSHELRKLERVRAFLDEFSIVTTMRNMKPTVLELAAHSLFAVSVVKGLGLTPNMTAHTKRIPETVWRMCEQDRRDFWEGVCQSDGATGYRQQGNVHLCNPGLVRELQIFVSALGIDATVSRTPQGYLLRVGHGRQYRIYPKGQLLADLDGFVPPSKMGDCQSVVDRRAVVGSQDVTQGVAERIYERWMPQIGEVYRHAVVKEVRVLGQTEDTFTLAVDDPLHQFVADGVVHKNTGGDQKYLAISVLKDYCTEIGAEFMIDLHDGLYFCVPDDKVPEFCAEGKRLLDNLPYEKAWGFKPPIPLPFDCKAGKSWGSLKGVKL